tara:strand:- start:948 stop:1073 length:126 start_codon:yes stop_codon:yes gene_type:complete
MDIAKNYPILKILNKLSKILPQKQNQTIINQTKVRLPTSSE